MVALRERPKGVRLAPFGLGVLVFSLAPAQSGYQDLGALIADQPAVSARLRHHLIASPFGTIHAATFSFPRPIGTAIPSPFGDRRGGLDPRAFDVIAALHGEDTVSQTPSLPPPIVFPTVERRLKGDRLAALPQPDAQREPAVPAPAAPQAELAPKADVQAAADAEAPAGAAASSESSLPQPGVIADGGASDDEVWPRHERDRDAAAADAISPVETAKDAAALRPEVGDNPAMRTVRLYFGIDPMGTVRAAIERWAPGEEPVLVARVSGDPDIKQSALAPEGPDHIHGEAGASAAGESVAGKGEVTGEGRRPHTPAERLALAGKTRAKAEKCLAEAVYFEARGEPERGQKAVAQVVMNRVFSGFYPDDVCGVVYQNAHRRLACQFTFACDNVRDVVREPSLWVQAKRIARDTLDGKLWLPEIGKATHYHATYVHPWWVRTMRKHHKIGVHIFYRPRKWGDGSDEPAWGSAAAATAGVGTTAAKL
jgi:spore germination cell wall hydrolase CwlJ-like protein